MEKTNKKLYLLLQSDIVLLLYLVSLDKQADIDIRSRSLNFIITISNFQCNLNKK